MSVAKAPKQGVITLALKDKNALYASYMPFLKNGGLFVPTNRDFEIGDEVFLLLTLLDDPQRHPITGKVAWLTTRAAANRPVGIGIQFIGDDIGTIQKKIESVLAGTLDKGTMTHTL